MQLISDLKSTRDETLRYFGLNVAIDPGFLSSSLCLPPDRREGCGASRTTGIRFRPWSIGQERADPLNGAATVDLR